VHGVASTAKESNSNAQALPLRLEISHAIEVANQQDVPRRDDFGEGADKSRGKQFENGEVSAS
jgi:hypothetical protein